MKFTWSLTVTGALVFVICLFVFGTMMQDEKPLWPPHGSDVTLYHSKSCDAAKIANAYSF
jgi:hypothetical protein